jgi:uncharacterized membrane protein YgdD (TMEM256/DUF423 family)
MTARLLQIFAGVSGLTGVALGAFGAHALNERLAAAGHLDTWKTAVQYQLLHAVGLLALAALTQGGSSRPRRTLVCAAYCWSGGIVLFSGSLYALSLGGPRWLGPVTPLGGLAFLAGWTWLIFGKTEPVDRNKC